MAEIEPTNEELLAENATLRRRIAELEDAEAKLRSVCAITNDLILVIDREGRYLEVLPTQSPLVAQMRALLGKTIKDVSPTEVYELAIENIRLALSTGGAHDQEVSVPTPDGQLWWTTTVTRLNDTSALWLS